LTEILYSPGAVGKYDTDTVPSLLSWQLISALLGPSTAKDKPPKRNKLYIHDLPFASISNIFMWGVPHMIPNQFSMKH
jgi:hypothetical protein